MKRSELREIIREALQGYSKYTGKTQGGTSADFMKILTAIAKGEKSQVDRGNDVLDKANPDNVAKILKGEKPVYEAETELTQDPETKEFTRRMKLTPKDKETVGKVQDMMAKEKSLKEADSKMLTKGELVRHLSELDPKSVIKITGVEGSGNKSTYSNSVENWQAKANDLVDADYEMQSSTSFKTDGKVFKSDTSQPPSEKAVRGMMRGQK